MAMLTSNLFAFYDWHHQPHIMDELEPGRMLRVPFGLAGCIDAPEIMPAGSQYKYVCKFGSWDMPSVFHRE